MINQDEVKNKLERIFEKYKFTSEERSIAVLDLIRVGNALIFDKLTTVITSDKKAIFEEKLSSSGTPEEKAKKINKFLKEIFSKEKLSEVVNSVYDKLISDYLAHMSQ